ncbi:unnamed protein product, partial [Ixodes pacificus]
MDGISMGVRKMNWPLLFRRVISRIISRLTLRLPMHCCRTLPQRGGRRTMKMSNSSMMRNGHSMVSHRARTKQTVEKDRSPPDSAFKSCLAPLAPQAMAAFSLGST